MRIPSGLRLFAMALAATLLSVVCLIELGAVEEISYAVEKGRLRALRDTLREPARLAETSDAGQFVAETVTPAVVSIEAEMRLPLDALVQLERELDPSAGEAPDGDEPRPPAGEQVPDAGDDAAVLPPVLQQGVGSGFILDADKGYVLTSAHVVDLATSVRVSLTDGRQTEARVLGSDLESDLAVLKIDLPRLHAITLGDSKAVRVGDAAFAVGSPYGLDGTVTRGIISAVDRRNVRIGGSSYVSLLQTDASISPGNSGGPLVNARGEVVGVNTAMLAGTGRHEGVGFAIPSSYVQGILDDLIEGGPGILGVWAGTASDSDWQTAAADLGWNESFGAVVSAVIPGTPAERHGVKADDIIAAIDGTSIDTKEALAAVIARTKPGTRVELDVWRERQHIKLPVQIGRKYEPRGPLAASVRNSTVP